MNRRKMPTWRVSSRFVTGQRAAGWHVMAWNRAGHENPRYGKVFTMCSIRLRRKIGSAVARSGSSSGRFWKVIGHCSAMVSVLCSPSVSADPSDLDQQSAALRTLYDDAEVNRYVCSDDPACDFEEFSSRLDARNVALTSSSAPSFLMGMQVEPARKGRLYFSAIFVKEKLGYRLAFAPDLGFSDVKLLRQQDGGYYMLRAVERDSAEAWKEFDFRYDPIAQQYIQVRTRCYYVGTSGKVIQAGCG
ncbi:hypothetical protein [Pseudoduganella albidiflava]|nr:hypothetical protein [Pseudoduganella albidiflava]